MERLTDFELQQIDNQLINDGTNTQVRKLVDEVKAYRQLEKQIGCPLEEAIKVLQILKEKKVDLTLITDLMQSKTDKEAKDYLPKYNKAILGGGYKTLTIEEMQLIIDWLKGGVRMNIDETVISDLNKQPNEDDGETKNLKLELEVYKSALKLAIVPIHLAGYTANNEDTYLKEARKIITGKED